MPGGKRWIRNGDAMTNREDDWRIRDIKEIIQNCEELQDNMNESGNTKKLAMIRAYEDIRDLLTEEVRE
jgi:hypothetical protein